MLVYMRICVARVFAKHVENHNLKIIRSNMNDYFMNANRIFSTAFHVRWKRIFSLLLLLSNWLRHFIELKVMHNMSTISIIKRLLVLYRLLAVVHNLLCVAICIGGAVVCSMEIILGKCAYV